MTGVQALPVAAILMRGDARGIDDQTVAAMAESIAIIGLINPIRVRKAGDGYEVIAGAHRLAAHKSLGLIEIECVVVDDDDLIAELAMIDENLCRAELSPSDRARQTARRKAIYLELHPETGHGGDRKSDQVENISTRSFAAETASRTGQSDRAVRMHAERGEKVIPEVMDLIRGTKLDTGTYLDKLKRMTPNDQVAAAKRDLALDKKAAREARNTERAEFDRQRLKAQEALPQAIKDAEARKAEAIAAGKEHADEATAALEAELDELREANAALEAEVAALKADNAMWQDMRVQFEQGGFEKVIADKDEVIRGLQTRVETESRDKVSYKRERDTWRKRAEEAGWSADIIIPVASLGGSRG